MVILKRPEEEKIKQKLQNEKTIAEKPIKALAEKVKDYEKARRKIFEKFEDIQNNRATKK
ncbi:uncharacterized protein BX663DRAFT_509480 [Cokeromyces recurvatus]|uniref:uncharacterized protein n=1 Tax=Cokeromyces recurvatus TaxID=90255 RepID=UPI00221EAC95|nr:uncharacterized protein BX663DRAFT_509480 [Cokeromyces recurvatus]KAI7903077.1 hypothetical protein BX663DRAFT_509480 [Cokeromyces recurvatus]